MKQALKTRRRDDVLNKVPVFAVLPDGWRIDENAQTAPLGYVWVSNNKSRFGGERVAGLLKVNDAP